MQRGCILTVGGGRSNGGACLLYAGMLLLLLLLTLGGRHVAAAEDAPSWLNSTDGIHTFLTFDSGLTTAQIRGNPNASRLDYVWGASAEHIPAYRESSNPHTVLSSYIPYVCPLPGVASCLQYPLECKTFLPQLHLFV